MTHSHPEHRPGQGTATAAAKARRLSSEALFQGAERVLIEHRGEVYILRLTRSGRLILTK